MGLLTSRLSEGPIRPRRATKLVAPSLALLMTAAPHVVFAAMPANPLIPSRLCDVTDYGAEGSRIWSQLARTDTAAFQRAIDGCAKAGGGTVRVPAGQWLIGPLRLTDHIRLHLEKGATLVATSEIEAFPSDAEHENRGLIEVSGSHDVLIDGEGGIDGQGAVWWERMRALWRSNPSFAKDGAVRQGYRDLRPRLILISNSRNVAVRGITIANSPSYHVVISHSDGVSIEHTTVTAPTHSPNTDGIDPIDSRHVLIQANHISVGDDMVAIKSDTPDPAHPDAASEDIWVIDNDLGQGRGLCVGSDTRGGVRDVLFAQNRFSGSLYGVRIKSARGRGGRISGVRVIDTVMTDVEMPLMVTSYYGYRPMNLREAEKTLSPGGFILGNQSWPAPEDPTQPLVKDRTPEVTDMLVERLTATGAGRAEVLTGLPEAPIALTFEKVVIRAAKPPIIRHTTIAGSIDHR